MSNILADIVSRHAKFVAVGVVFDFKAGLPANVLHGAWFFGEGMWPTIRFIFSFGQCRSGASSFRDAPRPWLCQSIADDEGEFGFVDAAELAQTTDAQYLRVRGRGSICVQPPTL